MASLNLFVFSIVGRFVLKTVVWLVLRAVVRVVLRASDHLVALHHGAMYYGSFFLADMTPFFISAILCIVGSC